jgi:hypothetical protein
MTLRTGRAACSRDWENRSSRLRVATAPSTDIHIVDDELTLPDGSLCGLIIDPATVSRRWPEDPTELCPDCITVTRKLA